MKDLNGDVMVEIKVPFAVLLKYKKYVESTAEVEAYLFHVATIHDPEQRVRMVVEGKSILPPVRIFDLQSLRTIIRIIRSFQSLVVQ